MQEAGWMLFLHSLPAGRSSERVTLWRKLKRLGVLALETGGHLLPDRPELRERLRWLVEQVRQAGGEAVLALTHDIEGLPRERIVGLFQEARAKDYEEVLGELRTLRRKAEQPSDLETLGATLERLRAKLAEIEKIDYFPPPAAATAHTLLGEAEALLSGAEEPSAQVSAARLKVADYQGRQWLTRPRPEIDRAGSAWLIRRCVDPRASFVFATDPAAHPDAIPFDLPGVEFSHHGDDCTFETLLHLFSLSDDPVLARLGEMVHDADLEDGKFARPEALGLDHALKGWALLGVADEELLRRGGESFDALHAWLETTSPSRP